MYKMPWVYYKCFHCFGYSSTNIVCRVSCWKSEKAIYWVIVFSFLCWHFVDTFGSLTFGYERFIMCVPGSIFLHLQLNMSLFLFDKKKDTGELTHTCAQWMGSALSISDHCCPNSLKRSWGRSRRTETSLNE